MRLSGTLAAGAQAVLRQQLADQLLQEQLAERAAQQRFENTITTQRVGQEQRRADLEEQRLRQADADRQIQQARQTRADKLAEAGLTMQVADTGFDPSGGAPVELSPEQAQALEGTPYAGRLSKQVNLTARPIDPAFAPGSMDETPQARIDLQPTTAQTAAQRGYQQQQRMLGQLQRVINDPRTPQATRLALSAEMGGLKGVKTSDFETDAERSARIESDAAARARGAQPYQRPQLPVVIQTSTGPQLLDRGTGTTRDITSGTTGTAVKPPDTADMRNKQAGRQLVAKSIDAIEQLGSGIISKVGPEQRISAVQRGAAAVFGKDPQFKTYQDARMALAGNLAVGQQGSRPSDADIKAIWLPLVPDPYTDTADSWRMKWDLIRTMSNVEPGSGGASTAPPKRTWKKVG